MKIVVLDRYSIGEDTPLDGLMKFGEVTVYDKTSTDEIDLWQNRQRHEGLSDAC